LSGLQRSPQGRAPWWIATALLTVSAIIYLSWTSPGAFFEAHGSAWRDFFASAIRPTLFSEESGVSLFGDVVEALWTTVLYAVAGMSVALPTGVLLGLIASDHWWVGSPSRTRREVARAVSFAARGLAAFLRSVHELLWAMLWLSAWGLTPMSAAFAIALPYAGTLAKIFIEIEDESSRETWLFLRECGRSRFAAYVLGVVPEILGDFGAYAFYRFECALRSAAVLGFFGFPTIGYSIALAFENLHYRELWTFLYVLLAVAALMELWSGRLRLGRRRYG
jgi:phosphonate transport system permease protein